MEPPPVAGVGSRPREGHHWNPLPFQRWVLDREKVTIGTPLPLQGWVLDREQVTIGTPSRCRGGFSTARRSPLEPPPVAGAGSRPREGHHWNPLRCGGGFATARSPFEPPPVTGVGSRPRECHHRNPLPLQGWVLDREKVTIGTPLLLILQGWVLDHEKVTIGTPLPLQGWVLDRDNITIGTPSHYRGGFSTAIISLSEPSPVAGVGSQPRKSHHWNPSRCRGGFSTARRSPLEPPSRCRGGFSTARRSPLEPPPVAGVGSRPRAGHHWNPLRYRGGFSTARMSPLEAPYRCRGRFSTARRSPLEPPYRCRGRFSTARRSPLEHPPVAGVGSPPRKGHHWNPLPLQGWVLDREKVTIGTPSVTWVMGRFSTARMSPLEPPPVAGVGSRRREGNHWNPLRCRVGSRPQEGHHWNPLRCRGGFLTA